MSIYIGIDPAFRDGGFWACIIDTTDRTANFKEFNGVENFIHWIYSDDAPEVAFWCVENSNLQNKSFDMTGSASVIARKARNVGTNQAVSEITCRVLKVKYGPKNLLPISPQQKGAKIVNNAVFLNIVKSDGLTLTNYGQGNQDKRDAYKIAMIGKQQARIHQQSKR